ncbi:MAG: hypothetical protein Kow0026_25690 [Oricola sp.]
MKKIGIALLIFNIFALAGCAGGNAIDQAVPQAAFSEASAPLPPPAAPGEAGAGQARAPAEPLPPDPLFESSGRAAVTGGYPNINVEPHGAVPQLTDAERDELVLRMQALAEAHAQGEVSNAEYERRLEQLRTLAATHSRDTIESIEE